MPQSTVDRPKTGPSSMDHIGETISLAPDPAVKRMSAYEAVLARVAGSTVLS
jgi:hypothetical protein